MKARMKPQKVLMTREQISKIVEQEFTQRKFDLYQEAVQDITVQVLANVLCTLDYWYGWKKDRLFEFIHKLHSEEDDMVDHNITTIDNIKRIKNLYGIDLAEEFPARIEHADLQSDNITGIWGDN